MNKQKIELLKPYIDQKYSDKDFINFDKVPATTAQQFLSEWPNTDPQGRQNRSPTMKKLVETALQYDGTLNGYCVTVESGRDDARVQFDAIVLKIDKPTATRLRRNLKPNNLSLLSDGTYRFWWD